MTLAIALGLPLGSVVGHTFGWRSTFLMVAVLGVIAIAGVVAAVPRSAATNATVASLSKRMRVVRQESIMRSLAVTLFWSIGAYTAYPYIAPYLMQVLDFAEDGVAATVTLWGVFAALGVSAGGALNDKFGSERVVTFSLFALGLSFLGLTVATVIHPPLATALVMASVAGWGFSVWSFFPAQMA